MTELGKLLNVMVDKLTHLESEMRVLQLKVDDLRDFKMRAEIDCKILRDEVDKLRGQCKKFDVTFQMCEARHEEAAKFSLRETAYKLFGGKHD